MDQGEQNRSEPPTPFKLSRARRKGTVARGTDLGFLTALLGLLVYMWLSGPSLGTRLSLASRDGLATAAAIGDGPQAIFGIAGHMTDMVARPLLFLMASLFAIVLLFELVQTGIVFSGQPLKPDFSRLSPAKGMKRVFSLRMLIETAKNVLKLVVYVAIAWFVGRRELDQAAASVGGAPALAGMLFEAGLRLVACFTLAAAIFAALDQLIVRKEFLKTMRMSRRELRRELRDREGEPRMKQRRKQLHAEFVKTSRSLRNIRGADVVVANPAHFAVALRYDPATMAAPCVVSRGANAFAQRLKRLAFLYNIVIVEDKALARALFHGCAIDSPVPEACYRQVADIYIRLRAARPAEGQAA